MFRRLIFKAGYYLKRPGVMKNYNRYQETQWLPLEQLRKQQEQQLAILLNFAYENVPYYSRLFKRLDLTPNDITTIQDLEKLPVLTKQIIKDNLADFTPKNLSDMKFIKSSTGGSTGNPMQYLILKNDWDKGVALMLRGWGYADYKPGDKVAIIAGTSLIPTTKNSLYAKIQNFYLNRRSYSAFDMSQENMMKYFIDLNKWKPDYIRGYASSIYLFSKFIQESGLQIEFTPKAIFTTAEKLFDKQRELIEQVFNVGVFDQYGLNDGGITTFECEQHSGMHIDMERAVLETVDDNDKQVINQQGRILATSLHNYAMPFIRYDTGDLGIISQSECTCGRQTPILKEIAGRISEFITPPSGVKIHGGFFNHLFREIPNVSQFQILQNKVDEITIRIVPDSNKTAQDIDQSKIKKIIALKDEGLRVKLEIVTEEELEYTSAGKYKYIINNVPHE